MRQLDLDDDIRPVTEFRAKTAELIDQVRETGRPVVLTERGKSAAVLLSVAAYEQLLEELDLLRDIRLAEAQIERGEVVPHREAIRQIRARIKR